ncbi:MAG: hypothetical protein U0457_15940 [Candidatus Sericytochromatia bacterium]
MSDKKNTSDSSEMSNEQLKAIENTYSAYTDIEVITQDIEYSEVKEKSKPKIQVKNDHKKIVFNISTIADLKPEVQDKIKRLSSIISEDKIRKLVKEIEHEKDLFTNEKGVFGKLTENERITLEKKLEQLQVPDEINKANIAAIVSCIDNILVEVD